MRFIAALVLMLGVPAMADHDNRSATDKGTYISINSVTGSSVAGTAFLSANAKRMDAVFFNNTSSTIWLGTTTTTTNGATHPNISSGTPVLSSTSFSLGGAMSDALYFTCNTGVSSCEGRIMESLNR